MNFFGVLLLIVMTFGVSGCNGDDEERWVDSIEDGGPFQAGHAVRFYYIDGEGNDLIDPDDLSTLPVTSESLLPTPPAAPTELISNCYYNDGKNDIWYDEWEGLYSFYTCDLGDSRYRDGTFYVYFKGEADEMKVQHEYLNKRSADGSYISSVVSWWVNGDLVYSKEEGVIRKKVFIRKADGKTTIAFKR